jgi:hypothetical protein
VVYRARTVLLASSKARACNSSLVRCILSSKLASCSANVVRAAEFLVLWNLRPTDHSSRTRFVASRLHLASRAGRLNSGVMRGRAMIRLVSCKRLSQLLFPGCRLPLASATPRRALRSVQRVASMSTAPLPSARQALAAGSPSPTHRFPPPTSSRLRIASAATLRRLPGAA